jgi:RNase P/RNase MRP subunit p30
MKLIVEKNYEKLRKKIIEVKKAKEEVVVLAGDDDFNRRVLEQKNVDVLLFSDFSGRDKLKQRDSGLNQVLCKIAAKNKIVVGIDVRALFLAKNLSRALARVMQNIRLCRKYKVRIVLVNVKEKDKKDLHGFLLTLGADTKMVKNAVDESFDV